MLPFWNIAGKRLTALATGSYSQTRCLQALLVCIILLTGTCRGQPLQVQRIANPDYPIQAHTRNIQGTVRVDIEIGPDGRVLSAKASGAHGILVDAAEKNVRQWVFGPFPPVGEFPIYHTVTYVFRLEGKPAFVAYPPLILTHLPDRVEIRTRPFESDLVTGETPAPRDSQEKR